MATKSIITTVGAGISRGDAAINQAQPTTAAPASTTGASGNLDHKPCMNSGSRGEARRVQLSQLNTTDIQVRMRLDPHVVAQYADHMLENIPLPRIVVYDDDKNLYVADGLHRVAAADKMKYMDIDAEVRKGTRLDALWWSLAANKTHGLRLSRADVRHAIGVALKEFPDSSSNSIAKQIGCSDTTVNSVREEMVSTSQIGKLEKTIGADGKARPAKRKKVPIAILSPQRPDIPPVAPASDSSEDTGHVQDATDTTGVADSVPDEKMKAVGLAIAAQAITLLEEIPSNDPERAQSLELLLAWLKTAMTPTCPDVAAEGTVPA